MHSSSPDLTVTLRSGFQRRLRLGAWALLGVLGVAGTGAAVIDAQQAAIPFPVPVYAIEAVSGDHTASLLNLPLGQPGVPQAPIPVDVDGDLLPDITVAVNLVDAEGLLNNPPDVGEVIAPNVEITRLETATLLARVSPPVRVNVKFTVTDLENEEPDTIVRFGYDTGEGGSIPQEFKALVGGLDDFFNPLEAVIDTTGGPLGLDPGVEDLGLAPASSSYEGPLTIVAGVETGDVDADIDLEYSPFPEAVRVTFGWDETGQHLTYAHDRFDEVDLRTDVDFTNGADTVAFDAAIDRLPRSMAVDLFQDGTRGAIDYQARADERLPDIRADLRLTSADGPPLNAAVDVEDLPRQMHAGWDTATPSAEFLGSGNGIGAIEARITTFDGEPLALTERVPGEQQYVALQQAPGGDEGDELIAAARLERIRSVSFAQDGEGLEATVSTGDGQLPLEVHGDLDLRASGDPHLSATATIAPLPDDIEVSVQPEGGGNSGQPFRVTYDASAPVDIDTAVEVVEATAEEGADCGDPGTLCADLAARHVPNHMQARVIEVSDVENRIEVDADGDPGAAKPDLDAHVVIGQEDGVPLVADATISSLARDLRIRTLQGADETLEKFEFHTCDRVYAADPVDDACAPGTEDEIGLLEFGIANFIERPEGLPAPKAVAPNHATVTGRGTVVDGADVVRFEATGRIESIEKVQYVNSADIFGVSTTIGDDQDLEVDVDLADIDFEGDDPRNGRVDVLANAVVSPLPDDMTFCFADTGRVLTGPTDPVTAECEGIDPFGDGVSPDEGPMVVAYRANTDFDLAFDAALHLEGLDEASVADDQDIEAALAVDNIPAEITAVVQPASSGAPMRGLVTAPNEPNERLDVDLRAAYTTGGTDCDDPRPTSDGDVIVACAEVAIDDLPQAASFLVDTTDTANLLVSAHACDLDVPGTGECRPGTESEIVALDVDGRVLLGQPRGVAHHEPSEDQHLIARADVVDEDNLEIAASMRLEEIRSVTFSQTPDGMAASTDLGTGVKPLEVHGEADLRTASLDDGYRIVGDVLVDPLPRTLAFSQVAPGADQTTDPMTIAFETNEADSIDDVVDVDVAFELKEPEAAADDLCGAAHTACAALDLDRLPRAIDVEVSEVETADGDDVVSELLADVATTQHAVQSGVADKTDLVVDATLGPDTFGLNTGTPLVDGKPLVAHLELNKLPTVLHARTTDRIVDDGTTSSSQLETVDVHTCAVDDPGLAVDGTCEGGDDLGELVVNVRNFLLRPGDLPPPDPTTPVYVTLTGRGELFETEARLDSIRDVAYANYGDELGVAVGVGSGQDFSLAADIKDFTLDELSVGDLDVAPASLDLDALAVIRDLPTSASFCLRNGGIAADDVTPRGGFLSPCEQDDPFEDGAPLTHTPMSVAYRATNDITVETDAQLVVSGSSDGSAITPRTIRGSLDIVDIPAEITTHFLMPEDDGDGPTGPMRLLYDTSSTNSEQMDIHFDALMAVGDAICEDPRPTADAICARADINNLPSRVEMFLDPTVDEDNFFVRTPTTDADLEFTNLLFASVKPTDDPEVADVMVIEGAIEGIPHEVVGSLDFPVDPNDAPSVRVMAEPPIGRIAGTFRNFIAPDPTPQAPPAQRAGLEDPTQEFVVFQRGDALRASVEITNLAGGGFETLRTASGDALPTSVISVDFGGNETVRAYADLMPDAASRTIGDVTLEDLPAGIEVCFRGTEPTGAPLPPATRANYCDTAHPASGAFQFVGTSVPDDDDNDFSVHAFVRQAAGGGADVISGDLSVIGIPPVIQGTFPSDGTGDLDVGGYKLDGTTPDGIDEIRFNLASFDVDTHGYGADIPFQANTVDGDPFPAPASARQHLSAVTDMNDVQARGRLGLADDALPSSRFQRVRFLDEACNRPEHAPPDYPFYPVASDDTSYKCIRVDLEQTSAEDDPMDLHVEAVQEDGNRIRLRDAGFTNLPSYLQLTLAETPTLDGDGALRRRCGVFSGATDARFTPYAEKVGTTDCMPPLLRFDQPDTIRLFGTLEYGSGADLATLAGVTPRETLADLNASPAAASNWSDWGADPLGIRLKVAEFGSGDEATTAARANLRLPIPNALQVDQIQSWSKSSRDGKAEYWDASDFRFHFVAREDDGDPVTSLGQLTGMYQAGDGTQVLLSRPRFDYDPPAANGAGAIDPDDTGAFNDAVGSPAVPDPSGYDEGILIPGEVGLDLYTRNHRGRGENFTQVDGILSDELDIGLRALGGSGSALGRAEAQVVDLPGRQAGDGLEDPSFRFRFNTLGEGASPPTGSQPETPDEGDDGSECSIFYCARTEVKFKDVFLNIDFDPTDDNSHARRVDAVVNTRDGKQGVEVAGYASPDVSPATTVGSEGNRVSTGTPEGITAQASIDIDPINVFIHAGIPVIGGADFVLLSDFQAGFGLDNVHDLQLRHNILHVNARSYGGPTTLGPFHYNIHLMHGSAYLLFVKLFGIDFIPPSPPPYLIGFVGCDGLSSFGLWSLTVGGSQPDEKDFVIAINNDPRLLFSGVLGSPLNILKAFIAPFFCLTDVSTGAIPLITADHPGDPVGTAPLRAQHHPVPGAPDASSTPTPPAPPAPTGPASVTVSSDVALCGPQAFTNFTVNSGATVTVATAADSTPFGDGVRCDPGGDNENLGTLQITAVDVVVNGAIRGDAMITANTSNATSNGGAGHGGAGGDGSAGSGGGGAAYGSADPNDSTVELTEPGARGNGNGRGSGGGAITINATDIVNNGAITVNGGAATDQTSGQCDVFNDDDPPTVVTSNTGVSGGGGGSGGGIVLLATNVDNNGAIQARGGAGADGRKGGGGGGAGGIVEVISPLYSGSTPSVTGGAGGQNLCDGDASPSDDGAAGADGATTELHGPQSKAESPEKFWYPGAVDVPISAAARDGDEAPYEVVVCSLFAPVSDLGAGGNDSLTALFDVPDSNSLTNPCGSGGTQRATHEVSQDRVVYDPGTDVTTVGVGGLADGYHGFYTVVRRVDPATFFDCVFFAQQCEVEQLPEQVDVVVGSDATKPTLLINQPAEGAELATSRVTLDLAANDQAGLSGVDELECSNNGSDWFRCENGSQQWDLLPGDGARKVHARAYDLAGNVSHASGAEPFVNLTVDATAPTASVALTGGVQGDGGWYRQRPDLHFSGYADGSGVGAGGDPFVYAFDGGSERTCGTTPSCTADATDIANLTLGAHEVTSVVRDRLGNERALPAVEFLIDDEAPLTALRTVPEEPDTLGWFTVQPWVVLSALDQVGASGVDAIRYTVDGGAAQLYDGPFLLGPGVHDVCFWAEDVAGNVADSECVEGIQVDDAAPAGSITFDGNPVPAPTGDDGWFASTPDVELSSFADDQGATPAGGTFRYRIDNTPYIDCGDPCTLDTALLDTGRHLVHWTALDRLGNQRDDGTFPVDVDTEAPATRVVVTPEPPGRGLNGWHWEEPYVLLDAVDQPQGSGVAYTRYNIDGGPSTAYTGPFQVPEGEHAVCVTSKDRAGNTERSHCVELSVDASDPMVDAAAPAPTGADGWHLGPIPVTVTGSDDVSGVDPTFDPSTADLCAAGRQDEDPTAPSGTCLAVDGGPFVTWDGAPLALPEGVHRVRSFSQDVSGRRSAMLDETYRIDATPPVADVRLVPAEGNDLGWYRRVPTMVLRADDGDAGATSAVDVIEYRIDGGPWVEYERPVRLTDGILDVDTRVTDVATNDRVDLDAGTFPIDVTPPTIVPRDPSRLIWSRLLGPKTIGLRWRVTEDLSETVRIGVIIHDATGNVVRRLDGGVHDVQPGVAYDGSTTWDGRNQTLTGLVPVGVYYYRVVALDEAGNVAHSRESRPITIKLL